MQDYTRKVIYLMNNKTKRTPRFLKDDIKNMI